VDISSEKWTRSSRRDTALANRDHARIGDNLAERLAETYVSLTFAHQLLHHAVGAQHHPRSVGVVAPLDVLGVATRHIDGAIG
jgi:hypothetical protein